MLKIARHWQAVRDMVAHEKRLRVAIQDLRTKAKNATAAAKRAGVKDLPWGMPS